MQIATEFGPIVIQDHFVPALDTEPAFTHLTTGEIVFGALAYCSGMTLAEDAIYVAIEAISLKNPILGQRFGGPHHGRIHESVERLLQWARMGHLIYDTAWTPIPYIRINPAMASSYLNLLTENQHFRCCAPTVSDLRPLFASISIDILIAYRQQQLQLIRQCMRPSIQPHA